jgi:hypothetical protein
MASRQTPDLPPEHDGFLYQGKLLALRQINQDASFFVLQSEGIVQRFPSTVMGEQTFAASLASGLLPLVEARASR